ncbi:MAG: UbiX family flavin prenyltransferase [Clostridia bacterium]|nr:UbiX family flavin prenyltransferase [Clostridia bacterium]
MEEKRLVVGISGASGAPLAAALLKGLRETGVESHLILSAGAERTIAAETGLALADFRAQADVVHENGDLTAPPSSGTWPCLGMAVVPCSMKTAAGIHSGYSENLLLRAADVTLKEKRPLVLAARECPMSTLHLRNLYELSQMGAVVLPPVLSYYNGIHSAREMERHLVGKILDRFGIELPGFRRWEGQV